MLSAFTTPHLTDFTMPVIWSYGIESMGRERISQSGATPASVVWPANNEAIYVPFYIPETATFARGHIYNGATAAGNWDIGIYNEAGTRLASSGAVAMAGINAIQTIAFTASVTLFPGRYYMALANTLATATVFAAAAALTFIHSGPYFQLTAHPLPATATFATWVSTIGPCFAVSTLGF